MAYDWWYYTIGTTWLAQQLAFVWDTWLQHLVHDGDISRVIWYIVWHVGRCTWLAYWWMHMVGILVDAHVGMLIKAYDWYIPWMISFGTLHDVDVNRCCAWWAHILYRMYLVDILLMILYFIVDISFVSWWLVWHEFDAWTSPRIVIW